jgi:hypothetical protein
MYVTVEMLFCSEIILDFRPDRWCIQAETSDAPLS